MMQIPVLLLACTLGGAEKPAGEAEHYARFTRSGFHCVIGDNAAVGKHRERYNGIYSLVAEPCSESPFVEEYAGLNLEHYFDARPRPEDSAVLFEPRVAPMEFRQVDDRTAELHQPPTPVYKVESWTRFTLAAPNAIDMRFRCIPREDVFQGGFFGVFWASYINAPEDKSLYFLREGSTLDAPQWEQFSTQKHGVHSSLWHEKDMFNPVFTPPNDLLYVSPAQFRYSERFFYGRFGDMVLIYIFKPGPLVRFTQSPSGGGQSEGRSTNNPAWDFQMIVPDYKIGQEYTLDLRLVYKKWQGRDDVLAQVRRCLAAP